MSKAFSHQCALQIIALQLALIPVAFASESPLISTSRTSCVQIWSEDAKVSGTGFFVGKQHVATCMHVVSSASVQGDKVDWVPFGAIKIKTYGGETIEATVVSPPTQTDVAPLQWDFVVLKLKSIPKTQVSILHCCKDDTSPDVGSDAFFSGYPLNTPVMVTHKAMISGIDPSGNVICLESAINKGNSGGALLNTNGEIIGLITLREGGISKGLKDLSAYIDESRKHGGILLGGVDTLAAIQATITTLDRYISTGIGYAHAVKHLRLCLETHPELSQ